MEDNLSHYITIGVVATFRWLRYTIGILGVLGLLVAIFLGLQVFYPPAKAVVNPSPICNRELYMPQSAYLPPAAWGQYTKSIGSDHATFYVREAHGTGWCLVRMDNALQIHQLPTADGRIMPTYVHRWYEVPSVDGKRVEQLAPPPNVNWKSAGAYLIGCISLALIFGIWLPATIVAAVGRRWLASDE